MSNILVGTATLIDDKMKFSCTAGEKGKIVTDYTMPVGSGQGPTSLELFLASLCSCLGGTMAVLLRAAGKIVDGIDVAASGIRKAEHPTCFERIDIVVKVSSSDAMQKDIDKALMLAEQSICPVIAMIRGNVKVSIVAEKV